MNARYGESGAETSRSRAQEPPITAGNRMECPRLDTGNNSATPCSAPITAASSQLRCADTGGSSRLRIVHHESGPHANQAFGGGPEPGWAWTSAPVAGVTHVRDGGKGPVNHGDPRRKKRRGGGGPHPN